MNNILDGTLAEIKAADIAPADVPALIAAEEAGKTRKGVIAHLKGVIAAPVADEGVYLRAAVGGVVHDGKGGFFAEGDLIENAADPDGLIERGLACYG